MVLFDCVLGSVRDSCGGWCIICKYVIGGIFCLLEGFKRSVRKARYLFFLFFFHVTDLCHVRCACLAGQNKLNKMFLLDFRGRGLGLVSFFAPALPLACVSVCVSVCFCAFSLLQA